MAGCSRETLLCTRVEGGVDGVGVTALAEVEVPP